MKRVAMTDEECEKFKRFVCAENDIIEALDGTYYTDAFVTEANNGVHFPKAQEQQKVQNEAEIFERLAMYNSNIKELYRRTNDLRESQHNYGLDSLSFAQRLNEHSNKLDELGDTMRNVIRRLERVENTLNLFAEENQNEEVNTDVCVGYASWNALVDRIERIEMALNTPHLIDNDGYKSNVDFASDVVERISKLEGKALGQGEQINGLEKRIDQIDKLKDLYSIIAQRQNDLTKELREQFETHAAALDDIRDQQNNRCF